MQKAWILVVTNTYVHFFVLCYNLYLHRFYIWNIIPFTKCKLASWSSSPVCLSGAGAGHRTLSGLGLGARACILKTTTEILKISTFVYSLPYLFWHPDCVCICFLRHLGHFWIRYFMLAWSNLRVIKAHSRGNIMLGLNRILPLASASLVLRSPSSFRMEFERLWPKY